MRARCRRPVVQLLLLLCGGSSVCGQCPSSSASVADSLFNSRVVVTDEAQGARCAVAADLDGDGKNDLISASSTDNTVAWYRNLGNGGWSAKLDITYSLNGARIVTTGDVDGDGDIDAIAASYYDNTIRWFENDGTGVFTAHVITTSARHGQGVFAADLDGVHCTCSSPLSMPSRLLAIRFPTWQAMATSISHRHHRAITQWPCTSTWLMARSAR